MTSTNGMRGKWLAGPVAILACFIFVTDATARDDRRDKDPGIEDVVEAVNVAGGTITIAGKTFSVSESTRLFDGEGGRIRLSEIKSNRSSGQGDMVEYWLRKNGQDDSVELKRLRVIGTDYE